MVAYRLQASSTDERYYLISDHLGTNAHQIKYSDSSRSSQYYLPFGGSRGVSGGGLDTDRTYTGQVSDETLTGLMFYNARYYDPLLRRFISPDTIVPDPGNPQDLNRYTYVRNNPVLYRDDSGHDPDESYLKPAGIGPAQIRQIEHASARAATAMSQIDSIVGQMRTWDPDALLSDSQINTIIELSEAINEYNAAVNTIRKIAPAEWLTDLGTNSLDPIPQLAPSGSTWERIKPAVVAASHLGVSLAAGLLGYDGAISLCVGAAPGCMAWAAASLALYVGAVGHVVVHETSGVDDDEITGLDVLEWTVGAGLAGGSSAITRSGGTGGVATTMLRTREIRGTLRQVLNGWTALE